MNISIGVLDRETMAVHLFQRGDRRKKISASIIDFSNTDLLIEAIGTELYEKLKEDIEMLDMLISQPDMQKIQDGEQTLLFFGSAMTNFGVELFFKTFLNYARKPSERQATVDNGKLSIVTPNGNEFTGFVFKLQANLDPKHRTSD